jgi:integrase/recombinase XerD
MVFVNLERSPIGRPMSRAHADGLFDDLTKQLRFPVRPHMLRHTASERWRRQGLPAGLRQQLLGQVRDAGR